jgi:hypothetical protein
MRRNTTKTLLPTFLSLGDTPSCAYLIQYVSCINKKLSELALSLDNKLSSLHRTNTYPAAKLFTIFIVGIVLLFSTAVLKAQPSTLGRDFYCTFLPNFHSNGTAPTDSLYIYVVSTQPTTGTITIFDVSGTSTQISFTTTLTNPIFTLVRHWSVGELRGSNQLGSITVNNENERAVRRTFRIQTDNDVAVYALNQANLTSDASLILPVSVLGTNYTVLTYKADGRSGGSLVNSSHTPSEFAIVATEDNTDITFQLTAPSQSILANTPTSITLNAGQTYMIQTLVSPDPNLQNLDLSGTSITSTKPIAVFAGHQRATLPIVSTISTTTTSRDHLYEQMIPSTLWGRAYLITPLRQPITTVATPGMEDLYRVVANEDNTILYQNNSQFAVLNKGQVYEAPLTTAFQLTSNNRVMVALYKRTHTVNGTGVNRVGDPFMMIIPPQRQYLNNYQFQNCFIPTQLRAFSEHNFTIITVNTNRDFTLDGNKLTPNWQPIPGTCYVYAHVPTTAGAHTISSPENFALYVYGYGEANSYGYVGGMAFLPDIEEPFITTSGDKKICIGDSVKIQIFGNARRIVWSRLFGDPLPCTDCKSVTFSPSQTSQYVIGGIDGFGCAIPPQTITITVTPLPTIDLHPDTNVCSDISVTLKALGESEFFVWEPPTGLQCPTCRITSTIPPRSTPKGTTITYKATAYNVHFGHPLCVVQDSITIKYAPGIALQIPSNQTLCRGDSLFVKFNYGGNIKWSPADAVSCTNCTEGYIKPKLGVTHVKFEADSAGCVSGGSFEIRLIDTPTLVLPDDITVCENQTLDVNIITNASTVEWLPRRGLPCYDCKSFQFQPTANITYYVTARNGADNCSITDSFAIKTIPQPIVVAEPIDTAICKGGAVKIRTASSNVNVWEWTLTKGTNSQPNNGLSCTDCAEPIVIVDENTSDTLVYSYKAFTEINGVKTCEATNTVQIRVRPNPTLKLQSSQPSICKGESVVLNAQGSSGIQWRSTKGFTDTLNINPTVRPDTTTTYFAVTRNQFGCSVTDSITVVVNNLPTISGKDKVEYCKGRSADYELNNVSDDAIIKWEPQPSSFITPDGKKVRFTHDNSITYKVTASSPENCTTSITVNAIVDLCDKVLAVSGGVNLGSIYTCNDTLTEIVLSNLSSNGSQLPINISSVNITEQNGATAIVTSPTTPFIVDVDSVMKIPVRITPSGNGAFRVVIEVISDGKTTLHTVAYDGNGVNHPIKVSILSNTFAAGSKEEIPIYLSSKNLGLQNITKFDVFMNYHRDWMRFVNTDSILSPMMINKGWSVTSVEKYKGDSAYTHFRLQSATPLSDTGHILTPTYQMLLTNNSSYSPSVSIIIPDDPKDCIIEQGSTASIYVGACAYPIRAVLFSFDSLSLTSIAPNPVTSNEVTIKYSVLFPGETRITILNNLGESVRTIVNTLKNSGIHTEQISLQDIPSGYYTIRLESNGEFKTTPLVLLK